MTPQETLNELRKLAKDHATALKEAKEKHPKNKTLIEFHRASEQAYHHAAQMMDRAINPKTERPEPRPWNKNNCNADHSKCFHS